MFLLQKSCYSLNFRYGYVLFSVLNMALNLINFSLNMRSDFLPWNLETFQDELKYKSFFPWQSEFDPFVTNSKPPDVLT